VPPSLSHLTIMTVNFSPNVFIHKALLSKNKSYVKTGIKICFKSTNVASSFTPLENTVTEIQWGDIQRCGTRTDLFTVCVGACFNVTSDMAHCEYHEITDALKEWVIQHH